MKHRLCERHERHLTELRAVIAASRERGREMFPLTLEIEGALSTLVRLDVLEALLDEVDGIRENHARANAYGLGAAAGRYFLARERVLDWPRDQVFVSGLTLLDAATEYRARRAELDAAAAAWREERAS